MHLLGRALSGLSDLVHRLPGVPASGGASTAPGWASWRRALLAVCVLHIQQAHFFVFDSYLVTLIAASFYYCVDIAETGRWRSFALAGLFLGLALATKLSMVVFAPMLALAGLLYLWKCVQPEPGAAPERGRRPARPPAGAVGRRPGQPDRRRGAAGGRDRRASRSASSSPTPSPVPASSTCA